MDSYEEYQTMLAWKERALTAEAALASSATAATPAPADAAGAEVLEWLPGDKAVVEAVRQQSGTHKGVYLSSKAAKRLLRLIDATPTPAPATAAVGAAGEAALTDCDCIPVWPRPYALQFPTARLIEALSGCANTNNGASLSHAAIVALLAALTPSETTAAPAAPEAGPGGGFFLQGDPTTNPFGPR